MVYSLYTANYQFFVQMLVKARKSRPMSQAVLAQRLGKPQSFVSKYERCERRVDVAEFMAIADVLGLDTASFLALYRSQVQQSIAPQ